MKSSSPEIFIVSKPLSPPWNDGSKNLARDLVTHAKGFRFRVLTCKNEPVVSPQVISEPFFSSAGDFQPSLWQNAKTLLRVMRPEKKASLYHFFYAPNARTSWFLKRVMVLKKQKT